MEAVKSNIGKSMSLAALMATLGSQYRVDRRGATPKGVLMMTSSERRAKQHRKKIRKLARQARRITRIHCG